MTARNMGSRELVSRAVRRHFEGWATQITLRDIDGLWTDEGFEPGPEDKFSLDTSERRRRYRQYLDAVNWTDMGQVRRALRVFWATACHIVGDYDGEGIAMLERQGYSFDADGNPSGGPFNMGLREELLRGIEDPHVLLDHIGRIETAASGEDPALVIGSAKELVESTAKIVLKARGVAFDAAKDELPVLIKKSQIALGVHSSVVVPGADGEQSSRKILSGVAQGKWA